MFSDQYLDKEENSKIMVKEHSIFSSLCQFDQGRVICLWIVSEVDVFVGVVSGYVWKKGEKGGGAEGCWEGR